MKNQRSRIEKKRLKELAAGDETAFQYFYDQHWERLFLSAFKRTGSKAIAEEIVQDLFVDLWAKRTTLKIKESLYAYLSAALRYRILDFIRHEKVREKYIQYITHYHQTEKHYPLEELITKDLLEQIEVAESFLPPRCYTIYQLSRKHHFSNREIADHLNISTKTVENQITKALRTLRTHLGKVSTFLMLMASGIL